MTAEPARRPVPLVERAFQLAATGECETMRDLNRLLRDEGYTPQSLRLHGPDIRRALLRLMETASGPLRRTQGRPS